MIAVFVNCFAVLVGSVFGLLFAKKFSDELSDMIQTAAGIVTCANNRKHTANNSLVLIYNQIIVYNLLFLKLMQYAHTR